MGSTYRKVNNPDEVNKLGLIDSKNLGTILVNVDLNTFGIDVGT